MDLILTTVLVLIIGTIIYSVLNNKKPNLPNEEKPVETNNKVQIPNTELSRLKNLDKPPKTKNQEEINTNNVVDSDRVQNENTSKNANEKSKLKERIIQPQKNISEKPKSNEVKLNNYNKVIIFGPPDSKKTELFYKLLLGNVSTDIKTETSIQINESNNFILNSKKTTLIDIPGHSNFDNKISNYLAPNSLLLFTVSPQSVGANISQMAHKFYNLVTNNELEKSKTRLSLLVIFKEETSQAEFKTDFLEDFKKEMERIKFSRRTHVNSQESGKIDYIKEIKENFDFDHVKSFGWSYGFLDLNKKNLSDFVAAL